MKEYIYNNLNSQYGLYSSFMACFVYTILGSCKDVPVGPTAIVAILTRETLEKSHLGVDFAVLLTFISGCVSLLMGILQLGEIIDPCLSIFTVSTTLFITKLTMSFPVYYNLAFSLRLHSSIHPLVSISITLDDIVLDS